VIIGGLLGQEFWDKFQELHKSVHRRRKALSAFSGLAHTKEGSQLEVVRNFFPL
jgi:hypothetical protein